MRRRIRTVMQGMVHHARQWVLGPGRNERAFAVSEGAIEGQLDAVVLARCF